MTFNRMTAAAVFAASMSLIPATGALAESHGQNQRAEQNAPIDSAMAEFQACLESRVNTSDGENLRSESNDLVTIEDTMGCTTVFQSMNTGGLTQSEVNDGETLRSDQNEIETD
ncbi:hypothetical protein [Pararhodobacter oceanensis]|uniref:Uncharacterized protein n=1 Tax=Pararhodobacter oceanensis TaxID=2172121 RepID=A0A2T8HWA0_9RHOB|nr:hypothetical protein [Pararhodobacter oceanensis]PVH29711.1 hypothetical protein DDE20_06250 [Pararhodobacter oceanensis]